MSKDIVTYFDVMAEMWCAYFDGPPDEVHFGKYGFGDTEEQAIQKLKASTMIKPEQVPRAALLSFLDEYNWGSGGENWARNCIVAAINAWPHSHYVNHHEWMKTGELASFDVVLPVILPLSQEKNDD